MSAFEESSQSQVELRGNSTSSSSSGHSRPVDKRNLSSEDLCVFIEALDSYSSTIPEAVIRHNLQKGGCDVKDPRTLKVVALAADKFLADVINEAKEINAIRKTKTVKRKGSSTAASSLDMFDLERSLSKHRIYLRRRGPRN